MGDAAAAPGLQRAGASIYLTDNGISLGAMPIVPPEVLST